MRNKKLLILGLSIAIVTITSATHAKKIFPSDIIGRDLNYPGMGWLGHVGIATRSMTHPASITLKYKLVYQSKVLQPIYIKSIVDELREANNADLDNYLFGPLAIGYEGSGKNLLEPESMKMVVDYLKEVHYKYTPKGIKVNPNNFHRSTTAPYYFELIKKMGIENKALQSFVSGSIL